MHKKTITIKGLDFIVKFPTVGEMMEIEQIKLLLTQGRYVELAMSNLMNHVFLLDYADMVAYFQILMPELKKHLGIENWSDIEPNTIKELMKAYKNQFLPWFKPLLDDLYAYNKEEATDNAGKDNNDEKQTEE